MYSGFWIPRSEGIYWVGKTLSWAKKGRKRGGLLPCVCCGLFGRKGINGLSMMLSSPTKPSNLISCILL